MGICAISALFSNLSISLWCTGYYPHFFCMDLCFMGDHYLGRASLSPLARIFVKKIIKEKLNTEKDCFYIKLERKITINVYLEMDPK